MNIVDTLRRFVADIEAGKWEVRGTSGDYSKGADTIRNVGMKDMTPHGLAAEAYNANRLDIDKTPWEEAVKAAQEVLG